MEKNELGKVSRNFNYEVEDIERSLKVLNDILFVKIVLSEDRDIKEIHVITKDSSNPKKIIRDIESFLLAKYNIQVDYRKISIAQVKGEGLKEEQMKEDADFPLRLKFSDIKDKTIGNYYEVLVQLEGNKKIYEEIKSIMVYWSDQKELYHAPEGNFNL